MKPKNRVHPSLYHESRGGTSKGWQNFARGKDNITRLVKGKCLFTNFPLILKVIFVIFVMCCCVNVEGTVNIKLVNSVQTSATVSFNAALNTLE